MDRVKTALISILGAALAGALYGLAEAGAVHMEGRLWLRSPGLLLGFGALAGALAFAIPGAALGALAKGPLRGLAGGAAAVLLAEVAMAVATDPPPFQEAPWYVGSPVAMALGVALAGGALFAARRLEWIAPPLAALALAALALIPGLGGQADVAEPGVSLPNVLVITMDTTRADRIGAYGRERARTPVIDGLAADGALFEDAYAQIAVTGPSHTTIFTGAGTWNHGTLLNGIPAPEDEEFMAERLQDLGYRTGAFVSAYVLESKMGFDRGFVTYDDDFSWLKGSAALLPSRLFAGIRRSMNPDEVLERRAGETVGDAIDWLEAGSADRPWFLWVHLFDPHGPYDPPPPYDTMFYQGDPSDPANTSMDQVQNVAVYLKDSLAGITDVEWVLAQYDGEIAYTDEKIGELLAAVEARGETDETLVVLSGDHGESLGEHGVWFNHGDDVFDPSTQVPLIMRWPGQIPAGARVGGYTELTDILPTVYDLLRIEPPDSVDGASLVPRWVDGDEGRPYARSLIFDREANIADREAGKGRSPRWLMSGLRLEAGQYIQRDHADFGEGWYTPEAPETNAFESLASDPLWMFALDEELRAVTHELMKQSATGAARSSQEVSAEERARLEALGYIE